MTARFVVVANGTLSQPKLSNIEGMKSSAGHSFHTSRFDYEYTGQDLSKLKDKVVGIIGTGASAVQIIPRVGAAPRRCTYSSARRRPSTSATTTRPTRSGRRA